MRRSFQYRKLILLGGEEDPAARYGIRERLRDLWQGFPHYICVIQPHIGNHADVCAEHPVLGNLLVSRIHCHTFDHEHLCPGLCRLPQDRELFPDICTAEPPDRAVYPVSPDRHGDGPGGFAEHPQPARTKPGINQAGDARFPAGAVDVDHMRNPLPVVTRQPVFHHEPSEKEEGKQQDQTIHFVFLRLSIPYRNI